MKQQDPGNGQKNSEYERCLLDCTYNAMSFVCHAGMNSSCIRLRINSNGFDAHFLACAHHTACNFSTICDQNFVEQLQNHISEYNNTHAWKIEKNLRTCVGPHACKTEIAKWHRRLLHETLSKNSNKEWKTNSHATNETSPINKKPKDLFPVIIYLITRCVTSSKQIFCRYYLSSFSCPLS